MKYIKKYESVIKPKIGDYVIVVPNSNRFGLSQSWRDYLKCHIGKIVGKYYYTYHVEFDTADGLSQILNFKIDEIVDFSENREDLEYIEIANNYNL